jgi:hypothetical protein
MVHVHSFQTRFLRPSRYLSIVRDHIFIRSQLTFSFRGSPSEPEMAFDETAKALAMNGVRPPQPR